VHLLLPFVFAFDQAEKGGVELNKKALPKAILKYAKYLPELFALPWSWALVWVCKGIMSHFIWVPVLKKGRDLRIPGFGPPIYTNITTYIHKYE